MMVTVMAMTAPHLSLARPSVPAVLAWLLMMPVVMTRCSAHGVMVMVLTVAAGRRSLSAASMEVMLVTESPTSTRDMARYHRFKPNELSLL